MSNRRLILATLLAVNFSGFAGAAQAADPVTDAMQKTYVPYRVALFKTNSNAQDESRQAVMQAQAGWNRIVADYGAKPPVPYDRDSEFAGSLAEVGTVYAKAAAEIERNELAAAHDTLEQVREVMAGMRHRNQVIVYSDHMNAYHAQMERVLIDGGKTLAEPNGLLQLTAQVGALDYLAGRLKSEAPADYLQSVEFSTLYKAVEKSVADLKAALFAQDVATVKEAMGKIKGPYSKMFIKFG
jgi:hypothetical protein